MYRRRRAEEGGFDGGEEFAAAVFEKEQVAADVAAHFLKDDRGRFPGFQEAVHVFDDVAVVAGFDVEPDEASEGFLIERLGGVDVLKDFAAADKVADGDQALGELHEIGDTDVSAGEDGREKGVGSFGVADADVGGGEKRLELAELDRCPVFGVLRDLLAKSDRSVVVAGDDAGFNNGEGGVFGRHFEGTDALVKAFGEFGVAGASGEIGEGLDGGFLFAEEFEEGFGFLAKFRFVFHEIVDGKEAKARGEVEGIADEGDHGGLERAVFVAVDPEIFDEEIERLLLEVAAGSGDSFHAADGGFRISGFPVDAGLEDGAGAGFEEIVILDEFLGAGVVSAVEIGGGGGEGEDEISLARFAVVSEEAGGEFVDRQIFVVGEKEADEGAEVFFVLSVVVDAVFEEVDSEFGAADGVVDAGEHQAAFGVVGGLLDADADEVEDVGGVARFEFFFGLGDVIIATGHAVFIPAVREN